MARILSFIFMVFIIVPMLAPALGQLVLAVADWRAIFLVFLALAAVVALWLGLRKPETLEPARRIPLSPPALLANGLLILRHGKVLAETCTLDFLFGPRRVYGGTSTAISVYTDALALPYPLHFPL